MGFSQDAQNHAPPQKLGYLPQLDGLRAFAIGGVFLFHAAMAWPLVITHPLVKAVANLGWAGVDVFFVLSGFLITSILLRTDGKLNDLKAFFWRRVLRIWPLYFGLLFLLIVKAVVFHQPYPSPSCFFFLQNFLPEWPKPESFNQTWSLCVEEHFYLVWPLVIFFVPRRFAIPFLVAAVVASPIFRILMVQNPFNHKLIYTASQCRMEGIAFGSLIAMLGVQRMWSRTARLVLGLILLVAAAALFPMLNGPGESASPLLSSVTASGSLGIVLLALSDVRPIVAFLSFSPLRYVGKISYGLYMIHPMVFAAASRSHHGWGGFGAATAGSLAICALSWHFYESPFLKKRHRLKTPNAGERELGASGVQPVT